MSADLIAGNDTVVCRSEGQMTATVNDEVVILSVAEGSYFGLDEIGSDIWQRLETPTAISALIGGLSAEYDGDPALIDREVRALLTELLQLNLIVVKG